MASNPKSIRPAPILEDAIALNGGGRGLSARLAQIGDRYLEILRRAELPAFSDGELSAIRDALRGTVHEPAAMIRGGVWLGVEDSLPDGLAAKWGIDGAGLVEKLRGLRFEEEVKLVEAVEAYWAGVRDASSA